MTFADELKDFEFAIGQKARRIIAWVRFRVGSVMLELGRDHRAQVTPAVQCFPQRIGDVVDRVLLHDVTHRARPQRARRVKCFFVHRKNQHRHLRKLGVNCFR